MKMKKLIESFAKDELAKHGLDDWSFAWHRKRRAFGSCSYPRKTIYVSLHFVESGESEGVLKDTVLHEIAHAIAGASAGHGPAWKRAALKVGARPERCGESDIPFEKHGYKWMRHCKSCGQRIGYHRKPSVRRRSSCSRCSGGSFNEQFLMTLEKL